jgi:hypothetical protein
MTHSRALWGYKTCVPALIGHRLLACSSATGCRWSAFIGKWLHGVWYVCSCLVAIDVPACMADLGT